MGSLCLGPKKAKQDEVNYVDFLAVALCLVEGKRVKRWVPPYWYWRGLQQTDASAGLDNAPPAMPAQAMPFGLATGGSQRSFSIITDIIKLIQAFAPLIKRSIPIFKAIIDAVLDQ